MSGHRPWSLVKKNRAAAVAPLPPPVPASVPDGELVWGPVTFREAPEGLLRQLLRTIDEGRLADDDVGKMIEWARDDRYDYTLTWTEIP